MKTFNFKNLYQHLKIQLQGHVIDRKEGRGKDKIAESKEN